MIRRVAVVVFALTINPALLRAQDTALTVTASSADIYKGPTNVTPVIGHVSRGTVLPVARNLGSWVKVSWPDAPDGVGYIHLSMGRIGPAHDESHATEQPQPRQTPPTAAKMSEQPAGIQPPARTTGSNRPMSPVQAPERVAPASHQFGVGALVGYSQSIGASMRAWPYSHLGVQFSVTHNSLASDVDGVSVSSTQLEPGVVYGMFNRITDYVLVRPYVGTAVTFNHLSEAAQATTSTNVGIRVFGGAEFTFASAPRFGVSADVGYRGFTTAIPGVDPTPVTVSIAGHWYIR